MDLGLSGRVALVAGGSRGLGYASAEALAREGARVALFGRNEQAAIKAAQTIAEHAKVETLGLGADASRPADIDRAVTATISKFGGLDILVTNSGGPPAGSFDDFDDSAWQAACELLLLSAVRMVRAALPHLKRSGQGRIVAITSTTVKLPAEGLLLSNAVRSGVSGLVRSLAVELAPFGITVNQVCPGRFATQRTEELDRARAARGGLSEAEARQQLVRTIPLGRYGMPEELGAAVTFLASRSASYVTGVALPVDGGLLRGA